MFDLADGLVLAVYKATRSLPIEERYGLQAQIRRAAVSAACNIVEGCARKTTKDYEHFIIIALGSASEASYLLSVAHRLQMLTKETWTSLHQQYQILLSSLQELANALGSME